MGEIGTIILPKGVRAYTFSSCQYVREAVIQVEEYMKKNKVRFTKKKIGTPILTNYSPRLDGSPKLSDGQANYYQSLIGILWWITELGQIDIAFETSIMSSHIALPIVGHLQKLYQIFGYLKHQDNARLVFDRTYPTIDYNNFLVHDWIQFYGRVKEEIPDNMPEPKGREMMIMAYVEAYQAGCKLTRRSRTGFIIYINQSPIYWLSKKQNGVEKATFNSEFLAMKTYCEYIRGLRYKFRMVGIPLSQPAFSYGDNKSVLNNTNTP